MMQQHTNEKFACINIHSRDRSTSMTFVPERGGVACSLVMPGINGPRELLYVHDYFWDDVITDLPGGWPFCFPVCARLVRQGKPGAYLYDHTIYELPIHGFAWNEPWQVTAKEDDSITLLLKDNERTQAVYPFKFEVELRYQVKHAQLTCWQTYYI